MKNTISKRLISCLILIALLSVMLSSCSFIDQFTDKGKIKSTVSSYLSDIQSGVFIYDKYQSQYATDKAFSELEYSDEEAEIIMKTGMKKITFKTGDITADKGNKSGTCGVMISTVDVPKVIEGFGDHKPDYDELLEAVGAPAPAMSEHTITLSVTYDSAGKMWKVSDSSPLVEIMAKPYTELTFYPDPTETINLLTAAANETNYTKIEENSDGIMWVLPEDDNEKKFLEAFNSVSVFEIMEEPVINGNIAQVKINFTYPDMETITEELMTDVEFWALYLKPIILGAMEGEEYDPLQEESNKFLSDEFIKRIKSPDTKSSSEETIMELVFDEESGTWLLLSWNLLLGSHLADFDEPELSDDMFLQAGTRAVEMLYEDGEISKSEYNATLKYIKEQPIE